MSHTIFPNISINRRYESHAKRGLPEVTASDWVTSGVIPTFNTVSIIPGIENFAPERTETNSGFSTPPNFFPVARSKSLSAASISSFNVGGNSPELKY